MMNPAILTHSAGILHRNLGLFRKEYPGVIRSRDIEHVHRMRVAARRLATALSIFASCYPAKRMKAWQRDIRQITRTLGRARDLDIQIGNLKGFLHQVSEARFRPGVQRLLLRTRQARGRIQSGLMKQLAEMDQRQTVVSMEMQIQLILEKKAVNAGDANRDLMEFALEAIQPALDHFLEYDPYVDRVEAVKELHAMRLAAKRLRYTLECFTPVFPNGFDQELGVLRKIQEQLGIIHDCDVWEMNREDFFDRERRKAIKYFGHDRAMRRLSPGLDCFYEHCRQQRAQQYAEFVKHWDGLRSSGYWARFKEGLVNLVNPGKIGTRSRGAVKAGNGL